MKASVSLVLTLRNWRRREANEAFMARRGFGWFEKRA
jgi:hypothetical protein